MWNEVYVEEGVRDLPRVKQIIERIGKHPIYLENYSELWGRSKKPYLHKRDTLNLFIAKKEGQLLKLAPDAYGKGGEPHYYFIHAYNCIYECQYCYLQGYFNSPDIVLFINHEDILGEMQSVLRNHPDKRVWFHAGEFSDSLALSHLTGELSLYHEFCRKNPEAIIELRTKSVNTREIEKLPPLPNFIVSFSLSPESISKKIDLKTPGLRARLEAMKRLNEQGHKLAAHFDPIIFVDDFKESYLDLLQRMKDANIIHELSYLSLGVVRFTKDVYREVEKNYPNSIIHTGPIVKSFDGKVRYHRPLRMWMMSTIKELAISLGVKPERIYLCMEEDA